jgi:hypothetical protein
MAVVETCVVMSVLQDRSWRGIIPIAGKIAHERMAKSLT